MPSQNKQFTVLMPDDITLASPNNTINFIVADQDHDILKRIKTTHFDLILLDSTANYSELISQIKTPLGINNKTPVIAVINPTTDALQEQQYPPEFDDSLTRPITEDRLNELIEHWQTKAPALEYIQILLEKTKNNRRLTLTLFEKLFEELPLQIIAIKAALEQEQYDIAKDITHKLHGSVSFCGLLDIQQHANALESSLLNKKYASIPQHFLMLEQCLLNFTQHQAFILATLGN